MFMGSDTAAPSGDVCKYVLQLYEWGLLEYSLSAEPNRATLLIGISRLRFLISLWPESERKQSCYAE